MAGNKSYSLTSLQIHPGPTRKTKIRPRTGGDRMAARTSESFDPHSKEVPHCKLFGAHMPHRPSSLQSRLARRCNRELKRSRQRTAHSVRQGDRSRSGSKEKIEDDQTSLELRNRRCRAQPNERKLKVRTPDTLWVQIVIGSCHSILGRIIPARLSPPLHCLTRGRFA